MSLTQLELISSEFGKLRNFNLEIILLLSVHMRISIFTHQLLHIDYSSQSSQPNPILLASVLHSNTKNQKRNLGYSFTNS